MEYSVFLREFEQKYSDFAEKNGAMSVKLTDNLIEMGMSSLTFIKFIVFLEEEYSIEFDETYLLLESLYSLNEIANCTWKLLKNKM